jgi:hypothetical protein
MMCDFMSVLGRILCLTSQSFPGRARYLFFGRECNVHKDKSPSERRGKKGSLIEKGGILLLNGKVSI